jgi:hypothetical protein
MQHRTDSSANAHYSRELRSALDMVALVDSEEAFHSAYDTLLSALGNNHAGTYSRRAVSALPELSRLLTAGAPWARRTVIEALIDLCSSFEPEPGLEPCVASGLLAGARLMSPQIRAIAGVDGPASNVAAELLEVLGADV